MDIIEVIEKRKSVRGYEKEPVDMYDVEILVMAARCAPKAGAFHISVITNADVLREINDNALEIMKNSGNEFLMSRAALDGYQPLYGAPVLFLMSAPDGPHAVETCSCSATAVTFAATGLGLGSCYVITPTLAVNEDKALMKKIGIPEGFSAVCGVLAGYEAADCFSPQRKQVENVNYCK